MKFAWMLVAMAMLSGVAAVATGEETAKQRQERAKRDKVRIAVQQICPISGQKLGQHGTPLKVTVGKNKQEIFVCCKSCLKGKIDPKHWGTIHANMARAQRICPVMKHELPKKPKWTIVEGQLVYICCPPCTKKIAADPKTYLRQIDELYTASLQRKNVRR